MMQQPFSAWSPPWKQRLLIRNLETTTRTTSLRMSSKRSRATSSLARFTVVDLIDRWTRLRAAMSDAGLAGILLTTEPSIYYASGTVASRPPGLILSADSSVKPLLVCRDGEWESVAALTEVEVVPAGSAGGARAIADAFARL